MSSPSNTAFEYSAPVTAPTPAPQPQSSTCGAIPFSIQIQMAPSGDSVTILAITFMMQPCERNERALGLPCRGSLSCYQSNLRNLEEVVPPVLGG